MLACYCGIFRSIDLNVLGNLAELVCKFEFHADIAVFMDPDIVHKLNQDFTIESFNVLILHKGYH